MTNHLVFLCRLINVQFRVCQFLFIYFIIFLLSNGKQGDNVLGSVRPSVLSWLNHLTYLTQKLGHFAMAAPPPPLDQPLQSVVFFCVSNNSANAVDRLLIFKFFSLMSRFYKSIIYMKVICKKNQYYLPLVFDFLLNDT